ncbi:universal stress protein [Silvibacterium sp.]|uniref:universal stress protein n=1 Tax=Silvibacterium sp. TaxID=1964179 RepID=UPI0039E52DB0
MFERIVVALSEEPQSRRALLSGIRLAAAMKSHLTVLSVVTSPPAYTAFAVVVDPTAPADITDDERYVHQTLHNEARALATEHGIEAASYIVAGREVISIVEFLREHHADLLILGLHSHTSHVSRLWNSIFSLAQDAPCSILGVH